MGQAFTRIGTYIYTRMCTCLFVSSRRTLACFAFPRAARRVHHRKSWVFGLLRQGRDPSGASVFFFYTPNRFPAVLAMLLFTRGHSSHLWPHPPPPPCFLPPRILNYRAYL